jgi:ADP-heptose:LPS heptosyltransferase
MKAVQVQIPKRSLKELSFTFLDKAFHLLSLQKIFPESPENLFLLRTHAIGDVLLTTPVIRALKQFWPQSSLTMLVGEKSRPVLEGNPYIDRILSFPESWWFQHRFVQVGRLTRNLRRYPKDLLILFHASPLLHLWGLSLQAPVRVGFDNQGSGFSLTYKVPLATESQRYLGDINLDLVRILGLPAGSPELDLFLTEPELQAVERFLPGKTAGRWLVGVAPGGGQNPLEQIAVKQWPQELYANLLLELSAMYPITFILLGDRHDTQVAAIAAQVSQHGVQAMNLGGQTTLRELAAVIKHLDLLVTNDSSPLHLAVALKNPVVGLFGPTAARALLPPGPDRVALQSPAPCSPCYPFGRFPGCPAPNCMAAISVATVRKAVESLLCR